MVYHDDVEGHGGVSAIIGGWNSWSVSVSTIRPMCTELSDALAAAVPSLAWTAQGHAVQLAPTISNTTNPARMLPTDAQPKCR